MGNICRSPTAEAVFAKLLKEANLEEKILIDSAGTHAYHVGEPPDQRSIKAGEAYQLKMKHLRARQVTVRDFHDFDYVIAMDEDNLRGLLTICPESHQGKVSLLMSHADNPPLQVVPDPYYGGARGFEEVIELIELGANGLLQKVLKTI